MISRIAALFSLLVFFSACGNINPETGTLTDARDGKVYKTVKIGDGWWMAENLNFDAGMGSWCYDENPDNCKKTGRLYDWETAQKAAPEGWRIPTKDELEKLSIIKGGVSGADSYNSLLKGGDSGFNAVFGGGRFDERLYRYMDMSAFFWSSTPDNETLAWCMGLENEFGAPSINNYNKPLGFSIRCIKK